MDIIRLRVLTRKSKIGWGKYANNTVGELIESKQFNELLWLYYHIQWLTYTDELLDELKIFKEFRIEKPGVNHEMHQKRIVNFLNFVTEGKGALIMYNRKRKKAKFNLKMMEDKEVLSKQKLQAYNHGHIKI